MTGAIIAVPVVLMVTGGTTGIAVSWFRPPRHRAGATATAGPVAGIAGGVVALFAMGAGTGSHDPDDDAACGRKR